MVLTDRYFCNFSLFQSLPDSWAIDQLFPIMPIHRLDEEPTRRGTLQDVTCDSDGKIDHFVGGQPGEAHAGAPHASRPTSPTSWGSSSPAPTRRSSATSTTSSATPTPCTCGSARRRRLRDHRPGARRHDHRGAQLRAVRRPGADHHLPPQGPARRRASPARRPTPSSPTTSRGSPGTPTSRGEGADSGDDGCWMLNVECTDRVPGTSASDVRAPVRCERAPSPPASRERGARSPVRPSFDLHHSTFNIFFSSLLALSSTLATASAGGPGRTAPAALTWPPPPKSRARRLTSADRWRARRPSPGRRRARGRGPPRASPRWSARGR